MGTIPWNALVFLTLYMQLLGMSDAEASSLMSLFLGAGALGALLGGIIGDKAAARFPFHGRIAVTQFSVFTGIPMSWIILKVGLSPNQCPCIITLRAQIIPSFSLATVLLGATCWMVS